MHTVNEPINVPDYLAAYTVVINYTLTKADVEEELLDRFLVLAKPRIDSEKYGLLIVSSFGQVAFLFLERKFY